jgi:hypothetical protein
MGQGNDERGFSSRLHRRKEGKTGSGKTLLIVGGLNVCCKFEHEYGAQVEQDR